MAEYSKMIVISMITATLFLGGYREFPFLKDTFLSVDAIWHIGPWVFNAWFLGPIYLLIKVIVLLFGMIWVRATWPRIRYDRLMSFGWKVLLPLSLAVVVLTATGVLLSDQFGSIYLWSIPVVSIFAGIIAVLLVNLSLRRRTAHA
jgi:NADH-quinone oxidoreductase subunit H